MSELLGPGLSAAAGVDAPPSILTAPTAGLTDPPPAAAAGEGAALASGAGLAACDSGNEGGRASCVRLLAAALALSLLFPFSAVSSPARLPLARLPGAAGFRGLGVLALVFVPVFVVAAAVAAGVFVGGIAATSSGSDRSGSAKSGKSAASSVGNIGTGDASAGPPGVAIAVVVYCHSGRV